MIESIAAFFESLGMNKALEQVSYLLDPKNIPFAIWETLYAPFLATIFAYVSDCLWAFSW